MKKIILSEDQISEIVNLYTSGLSYDRIQAITGINHNKVKRTINEIGIEKRTRKNFRKPFTNEEKKEVIDAYLSGLTPVQVGKMFDCTPPMIRKLLNNEGIKIRSLSDVTRHFAINDFYFDEIDNQDKAYILGFLFADGSNDSDYERHQYIIALVTQMCDSYILDRISKKLEYGRSYKVYNRSSDGRQYAKLVIKNKRISIRLNELGIVRRKTFVTTFPEYLSDELIPHFIRGLMDGDGGIAKDLKSVYFAGSDAMMEGLVRMFEKHLGFTAHIVRVKHSPGISTVAVSKKEYKLKLLNWLYADADLKLERKYEKYLQMLDKYGLAS